MKKMVMELRDKKGKVVDYGFVEMNTGKLIIDSDKEWESAYLCGVNISRDSISDNDENVRFDAYTLANLKLLYASMYDEKVG